MTKQTKTEEEMKREFFAGINNYNVGSINDAKLDKVHNWIFQGDGDYLIAQNKIGKFVIKMNDAKTKRPGLPEEFKGNRITLNVPKIPKKIYYQILAFFRDICEKMGKGEAFVQVYYDTSIKEYVVFVPKQEVGPVSVKYDAKKNLDNTDRDRYIFVFECHSHNTMPAFFSPTDNKDEKSTRFFGVMGKIEDVIIEEKYRTFVLDKEILLSKESIFDFVDDEQNISFPVEWKDNVEKEKSTYYGSGCSSDWAWDYKQYSYVNKKTGETSNTWPGNQYYSNGYGNFDHNEEYYWPDEYTPSKETEKEVGPGEDEFAETFATYEEIEENFDLEKFTEGEEELKIHALSCIAQSIDGEGVINLLEALESSGFSYEMAQFIK